MFNTQMPKDSLMLWIFDGDEISKNIGEYKTTIANEASKSTMLFYCRQEKRLMENSKSEDVFYTTELVRYLQLKSEIPNAVSESKSQYAPEGTNMSFGWSLPTALLTQAFEYATKNKQYRQNQGKTGNERQII